MTNFGIDFSFSLVDRAEELLEREIDIMNGFEGEEESAFAGRR
jgi:hypothetical protein